MQVRRLHETFHEPFRKTLRQAQLRLTPSSTAAPDLAAAAEPGLAPRAQHDESAPLSCDKTPLPGNDAAAAIAQVDLHMILDNDDISDDDVSADLE